MNRHHLVGPFLHRLHSLPLPPLHTTVFVLTTVKLCSLILLIATNAQLVLGSLEDVESNQWTFGQIILVANPLVGSWRVFEVERNVGVGVQVGKKGNDDDDDLQGKEKEDSRKGLGHSEVDKESEMKGIRRVNGRMRMRGGSRCEKDQWRCWLWECRGGGGKFIVLDRLPPFSPSFSVWFSQRGLPYYDDHQSMKSLLEHSTKREHDVDEKEKPTNHPLPHLLTSASDSNSTTTLTPSEVDPDPEGTLSLTTTGGPRTAFESSNLHWQVLFIIDRSSGTQG
ncbi:hypothetical protein K435DRAFT_861036 [Dendrothele bispora CBS 962.96]|uniref:Uncharacterized protein n=1 Tax=Dendrothele bispora (strain CBS 962.96) TaxID=1314807 RepID=A0A4S8LWC8_DENBC|nr:hypothetical protein K435DRAFT_861036 [Dendrothele bispora CBS 962.96]